MEPLVNVTLTVYVPVDVFLLAAIVKNSVAVPPGDNVRLFELRVTEGSCWPIGVIELDMLMGPLNPPRLVRVRVETAIDEFVCEPL